MPPDDKLDSVARLDAMLGSSRAPELVPARQPGGETLEPLLAAARALRPLHDATPSVVFTRSLEARLLAEDARLASMEIGAAPALERAASIEMPSTAGVDRTKGKWSRRHRPPLRVRFLWSAIAAVLLLALGTLTAAAAAGPGSPFYALHRLEQTARVVMSSSPADRVNLHLRYARDALSAADADAHSGDAAGYSDALATVQNEMSAAADDLRSVAAGSDHDSLVASLASLRNQAIAHLRADLPLLNWAQRLTTTDALAAFGDVVPHVISATATRVPNSSAATAKGGNSVHTWNVQLTGTGFMPGARLLVNGQPADAVLSVTGTSLVATYTAQSGQPPRALGIANPDDTAAQVSADLRTPPASPGKPGTSGGPAATGTPGGSQNGGHGDSGNGGHSPHDATPTPTPHST